MVFLYWLKVYPLVMLSCLECRSHILILTSDNDLNCFVKVKSSCSTQLFYQRGWLYIKFVLSTIPLKGTSPSIGMPNFGTESPTSTGSMPNYPPGKLPPPFGMGGTQMSGSGVSSSSLPPASAGGSNLSSAGSGVGGTAAAAAAAAVLEAVNSGSRYPSTAQGPGAPYGNPQDMMMSNKASDNMAASRMSPMQLGSMLGPNVQTGVHHSYDYLHSFVKTVPTAGTFGACSKLSGAYFTLEFTNSD